MKPFSLPFSTTTSVLKHILILSFLWVLFGLALFGLFAPLVVRLLGGFLVLGLAFLGYKHLKRLGSTYRLVLLFSVLWAAALSFQVSPTVFSGRDQGSFSLAAIHLAENGSLFFSNAAVTAFFDHYGPGTALNFPGFAYTASGTLVTQFPIPYIAWLGSFFQTFGTGGLIAANAALLVLSLTVFYRLLHLRVMTPVALGVTTLFAASFLPVWIFKMTLSENLALYLYLILCYALILLSQERKFIYYATALLAGGLLCFTRIEGFVIFPLSLIVMALIPGVRELWRLYPWKSALLPSALFALFLVRDLLVGLPFYKAIGKALLRFLESPAVTAPGAAESATALMLPSLFVLYGLAAPLLLGAVGTIILARKRAWPLLIPFLLALPAYLYFLAPNITPDHPWLLRRFAFAVFPSLLLSATFGLSVILGYRKTVPKENTLTLRSRQGFSLLFLWLLLFALQWPAFRFAYAYAEHPALLSTAASLSARFSETDLVLIDRLATGDGYAMLPGPLAAFHNKNAAYFFNPEDLDRIDRERFSRTFLLIPEKELAPYTEVLGERMVYRDTLTIETQGYPLGNAVDPWHVRFPAPELLRTENLLFEVY